MCISTSARTAPEPAHDRGQSRQAAVRQQAGNRRQENGTRRKQQGRDGVVSCEPLEPECDGVSRAFGHAVEDAPPERRRHWNRGEGVLNDRQPGSSADGVNRHTGRHR